MLYEIVLKTTASCDQCASDAHVLQTVADWYCSKLLIACNGNIKLIIAILFQENFFTSICINSDN